jgi:hypothetical protein
MIRLLLLTFSSTQHATGTNRSARAPIERLTYCWHSISKYSKHFESFSRIHTGDTCAGWIFGSTLIGSRGFEDEDGSRPHAYRPNQKATVWLTPSIFKYSKHFESFSRIHTGDTFIGSLFSLGFEDKGEFKGKYNERRDKRMKTNSKRSFSDWGSKPVSWEATDWLGWRRWRSSGQMQCGLTASFY